MGLIERERVALTKMAIPLSSFAAMYVKSGLEAPPTVSDSLFITLLSRRLLHSLSWIAYDDPVQESPAYGRHG